MFREKGLFGKPTVRETDLPYNVLMSIGTNFCRNSSGHAEHLAERCCLTRSSRPAYRSGQRMRRRITPGLPVIRRRCRVQNGTRTAATRETAALCEMLRMAR